MELNRETCVSALPTLPIQLAHHSHEQIHQTLNWHEEEPETRHSHEQDASTPVKNARFTVQPSVLEECANVNSSEESNKERADCKQTELDATLSNPEQTPNDGLYSPSFLHSKRRRNFSYSGMYVHLSLSAHIPFPLDYLGCLCW